jgi:hypothetical protein
MNNFIEGLKTVAAVAAFVIILAWDIFMEEMTEWTLP